MKSFVRSFVILAAVLVPGLAAADQCAVVTYDVATKAALVMQPGTNILHYCPRCGAGALIKEEAVRKVEIAAWDALNTKGLYHEVKINGKGVDLAYVFVLAEDSAEKRENGIEGPGELSYLNVAAYAGCEADTARYLNLWLHN